MCVCVAERVCVGGVDQGLILGKSGDAAKAKSYFKAPLPARSPHSPAARQAAVARGLRQAESFVLRAEGSPGSRTFTPNELLQR